MINILEKPFYVYHLDNRKVYQATSINYKRETVEVVYTKINSADGPKDYIYRSFTFDEVEPLQYTGKHDDSGKEVMAGDIVVYGSNLEYTGEVKWNVKKLQWFVMEMEQGKITGSTFLLSDVEDQYIHIVENKYGRLPQ